MCKTIKQRVKFNATSREIYDLLATSKEHTALTGQKADISPRVGGPFSALAGFITGINVDLAPGKRIVQAWRTKDFPVGIFSMATFQLTPTKRGGTELVLTHRGVPKDLIPRVEKTWREKYWGKIKRLLATRLE